MLQSSGPSEYGSDWIRRGLFSYKLTLDSIYIQKVLGCYNRDVCTLYSAVNFRYNLTN